MPSFLTSFRASSFVRLLRRARRDTRGSIAVVFAVSLMVLCILVGAAVDIGRWLQARHQTSAALDASVLAAQRVLQIHQDDTSDAHGAAEIYYAENTKGRTPVVDETVSFAPGDDSTYVGTSSGFVETAFLKLAHIPRLPYSVTAKAKMSAGGPGGEANTSVEIALMLDVTGSMKGTKITDLKKAATDLVNIVINDSAQYNPVRVAIVPFAEAVRLPTSSFTDAVGSPVKIVKKTTGSGNKKKTLLYNRTETCVVERTGDDRYTDAAPGSGSYVTPYRDLAATISASDGTVSIDGSTTKTEGAAATIQWQSGSDLKQKEKTSLLNSANSFISCPLSADDEMMPLSNDKSALTSKIDSLDLAGSTAGQIGTAWAWYALSPHWNTLWPEASAAGAYGESVRKYAILMTDGEYNLQYDSKGIGTGESGAGSAANDDSATQARSICTAMKSTGITVFTVGFALGGNQSAIDTLNHCATEPGTAYTADDGTQLQQAFRAIALKISQLYLTQ